MINRERLTPSERQALIDGHIPLAYKYAREYSRGNDVPLEDLQQEAVLNLIVAVDNYDEDKGVPFIPYAKRVILNGLLECVANNSYAMSVSDNTMIKRRRAHGAAQALEAENGYAPSLAEISERTGYSEAAIAGYQSLQAPSRFGQRMTHEDGSAGHTEPEHRFQELREKALQVEDRASAVDIAKMMGAFDELDPQVQALIERRFGLNGREEETLQAIATDLGCTRQNVDQRVKKGLAQIRQALKD